MTTVARRHFPRSIGFRRFIAITVAAAALVVPTSLAYAQDNGPTDPGVRCAAKVGPGQYEFYLPGEKATDVNGNKWVCGPDGQWFRDYSSAIIRNPPVYHFVNQVVASAAVIR